MSTPHPPDDKVSVGLTTKSVLAAAGTAFAAAVANALAGGPVEDTITAAATGTIALVTMAIGRYAQAIALHGIPLGLAKIVDKVLEKRLPEIKQAVTEMPTTVSQQAPPPRSPVTPPPSVPPRPHAPGQPTPSPPVPPAPPHHTTVDEAAQVAKDKLKRR